MRRVLATGLLLGLLVPMLVTVPAPGRVDAIVGTATSQITPHEVLAAPPTLLLPTDADCPSATVCYLAARPVVKSVDAGRSWSPLQIDANDVGGLQSIDCLSELLCYGYSGASQLSETTDGGATWAQKTSPIVSFSNVVACATPTDCFAVGAPTPASLVGAVSHDGANTWSTQSLANPDGQPRAMDCASSTFCVAVGTHLVVTTRDAGVSWTVQSALSDGFYTGVSCPSANICVAVAGDRIISTTNGGSTWLTLLGGGTDVSCRSSTSCSVFGFSITQFDIIPFALRVDPTTQSVAGAVIPPGLGVISTVACHDLGCIAIGSPTTTSTALSLSQAAVLASNDGGASWTSVAPPAARDAFLDVACPSSSTCITVGDTGTMSASNGHQGFIRRTIDGGATWAPVALPAPLGAVFLARCTSGGRCVVAGTSTDGASSSAVIAYSTDSGASWSIAGLPPATVVTVITDVSCPAPSTCYATAAVREFNAQFDPGVLLQSTDGGQSWTRSSTFPTGHQFSDVMCASPSECFASIPDEPFDFTYVLWRTVDSGASWQQTPLASGDIRLRGCFAGRCFLDAFGKPLMTTVQPDGQEQWVSTGRLENDNGPMGCAGTTCIRLQGVFQSYISTTGDGGVTWTNARLPLPVHRFDRIDCPDPTVCFAVGFGGSQHGSTVYRFDVGLRPIVSVVAVRLLDTRPGFTTVDHLLEGGGLLDAGATVELPVGGRGGVPSGVGSVMLNVTVTNPLTSGFITVYPCGEPRPLASSVNFVAGATVANSVISKVGPSDLVCLYTTSPLHLIADVNGYTPGVASSIIPLVPARLLETRPGLTTVDHLFEGIGLVAARSVVALQVTGRAGVSVDAGSVLLNVTVTGATAPGFITVFPCDDPQPNASSVNYVAGSTVANLVVSKVGAGGTVCLYSLSATHLVIDVGGYTPAGSAALTSIVPQRVMETRVGPGLTTVDHLYEATHELLPGTVFDLPIAGRAGVPADASTVVLNVTVTDPAAAGFVTVFPCGEPQPTASNVNYTAGATVANAVVSRVGPIFGDVCIFTLAKTNLVVDVTGYAL